MTGSFIREKRLKKWVILLVVFLIAAGIVGGYFINDRSKIGTEIDSYKNVAVHYNGILYKNSYGKNLSEDGYSFGYKWQCVEFVKRFYYEAKGHKMPDIYGNAKDYFDATVKQGQLNESRGLVQYYNGENMSPKPDDLIVFTDTKYGHVAIVTEVTSDYVEVIQQNVRGKTREKYALSVTDGNYVVGTERKPAGWLRKE